MGAGGQPFAVAAEGATELPPPFLPPCSRLRPWRQPGAAGLISLASTRIGAGLFLEYFSEPGTVVSAGILMPIYFSKIPLDRGSGFGVFKHGCRWGRALL